MLHVLSATCDEIEIPKIECGHDRMTPGKKIKKKKTPERNQTEQKNDTMQWKKERKHSSE